MLKRYEKFLKEFDKRLKEYYLSQKDYINCRQGCSKCCETGEYPFSRLEAEYIMHGFLNLPKDKKNIIRKNIFNLKAEKKICKGKEFLYRCPFLIDNLCALYNFRGIVCRTHGLAFYDISRNIVKLPHCSEEGLNYSQVYNPHTKSVSVKNLIKDSLKTDSILRSPTAEKYELECGEIRPLIDWF